MSHTLNKIFVYSLMLNTTLNNLNKSKELNNSHQSFNSILNHYLSKKKFKHLIIILTLIIP